MRPCLIPVELKSMEGLDNLYIVWLSLNSFEKAFLILLGSTVVFISVIAVLNSVHQHLLVRRQIKFSRIRNEPWPESHVSIENKQLDSGLCMRCENPWCRDEMEEHNGYLLCPRCFKVAKEFW